MDSTLARDLCAAWSDGGDLDHHLKRFVVQTNSRSAGLWRLEANALTIVGFASANDMPLEVSSGFQDATRRVSMDQNNLGIVRAITTQMPVIAHRDPRETGLDGSASWIAKFGANTSLALPIRCSRTDKVVGAIAVASSALIQEGDTVWQSIVELAQALGSS